MSTLTVTVRAAIRAIPACAIVVLGVQSAAADLVYRVVYNGATRVVTADPPFSTAQDLNGFLDVAFVARTAGSFLSQNPPPIVGSAIPPVLDFRFSIGSFEWTAFGDHGVLGFTDPAGRISTATMGFERDACGGFSPCLLEISNDGKGGFNVQIYQPGIGSEPPVIGYRAEGVELVADPVR